MIMIRKLLLGLMLTSLTLLPACRTDPNRSAGTSIVGGTAIGAGLGALAGWAAGRPATGAAIGAGVGLIGGAIQADSDSRERSRQDDLRRNRVTYVERREISREPYRSDRDERRDRAYDYLFQAQRSADLATSEALLKRSLTEFRTPEGHTALGDVYEGQRDWSAAESEYRRALDLDPEYRPAQDALARLRRR